MKRIVCALAWALACILLFAGCQCEHKWDPATCTDPKICQNCGVVDGDAMGHSWKPATCNAPKTCETCKETEGKALAHLWADATCAAPKTCAACGLTEGETMAHTWVDADCDTPKTCSVCAATEGAPLGHVWQAPSCDKPQTCTVCAAVNGDVSGHSWVDATCDAPKTCSACNLTEGKALGHKWQDATTEKPKTCSTCGKAEGSAIKTDPRFTTDACQAIFGTWSTTATYTAEDFGITDYNCQIVEYTRVTFKNNGTMVRESGIDNFEDYRALLAFLREQETYASFAEEGMTKADADAAMKSTYGMNVKEYAQYCVSEFTQSDFTVSSEHVYYVKDGNIYGGRSWEKLSPMPYTLKGNKLTLYDELTGEEILLTRA